MAKKSKQEWKPKKVDGKIQRARTYAPGWDVICVRAPSSVIDKIRSAAKSVGKSISHAVAEKFGFKFDAKEKKAKDKPVAKKAAPKKAAKAKTPNHAPAVTGKSETTPAEMPF